MDASLLEAILAGSGPSWQYFFASEAGFVERLVRASRSMGSYGRSEDDCRNVMAGVFERLRRDDFRALRLYHGWQATHGSKDFSDWLTVVVTNVVRDYVSEKLGVPDEDGQSVKQRVNTWAEALGDSEAQLHSVSHVTTEVTAHQIYQLARELVTEEQLAALAGWLEGRNFEEISAELGLAEGAPGAEKVLRSALARLRRQLAG